jgi:hypothetical protein
MMGFYRTAFEAVGQVRLNLRLVFSESAVEAGASIALVLAGTGVVGAAFGRAIGYTFGTALALMLARRAIGARSISLRGSPAGRLRQIAGYAGALLIIDAVFAALTQIDILLIGAILGTSAVGIFQAPAKLITFLHYPGLALSAGVSPRLARGGAGPNVQAFAVGIRYLIILQGLLVVPTVVWAAPITDLILGDDFADRLGRGQLPRRGAAEDPDRDRRAGGQLRGLDRPPLRDRRRGQRDRRRRRVPDLRPGALLDLQAVDRPAGEADRGHVPPHARGRSGNGCSDARLRLPRAVGAGLVRRGRCGPRCLLRRAPRDGRGQPLRAGLN